jgi:hypothetical protein
LGDSGDRDLMCANLQLRCWSAPGDHARIGTLARTLSRVEFQPQWLRKPPAAGWFRSPSGVAHPSSRSLSSKPVACHESIAIRVRVLELCGLDGAPEGIGRVTVGGASTNQRWSQQQASCE